ncbi:hypothetical protein M6D93_01560 [Jatrophihabitans telluris]|uniref:Uncharacterized protein n=1 Tax=Jatrophihabitans telluris TaxID=2038343 RepID=A0ABY4QZQ4_9ACTN|nr:hypothetical protein [Jatrophihabitans telluris]UQX88702.1 hypothetical protein M6D93_01560 [Jatrophihabitans telluris]
MTQIGLAPIDPGAAADWVRGSLAHGSDLSMLITTRLPDLSMGIVIGPPSTGLQALDDFGRGIRSGDADAVVQGAVESMARAGAGTLVVEDDLARRGDAGLAVDVAFVGDRVVRWTPLNEPAVAVRLLRTGSSGYPLNAFVCLPAPTDLPLGAGYVLNESDIAVLAEKVCAVITSVYDAESFVILARANLGSITA